MRGKDSVAMRRNAVGITLEELAVRVLVALLGELQELQLPGIFGGFPGPGPNGDSNQSTPAIRP